jgi:hypothetical protein
VGISYSAASNRAVAVPVEVQAGDGPVQKFVVNQKSAIAGQEVFQELTKVALAAGQRVRVTISNAGTEGHVIVDAVQLEQVK